MYDGGNGEEVTRVEGVEGTRGEEVTRDEERTGPVVSGSVPTEFRDVDIRDMQKVREFCTTGCGCAMNCFTQFTMKHYLATRANTQQLDRKELDVVLHLLQPGTTEC